jgi:hypothetical protein
MSPPLVIDLTSIFDAKTIQPTALPTPLCSWLASIRSRFEVQSTALADPSNAEAGSEWIAPAP